MASTLTRILIHITFSTKHREPMIAPDAETDLYAYIGGICRRMESPLLAMGGTADHVHMMVSLAKTVALADLLLNVKRDASRWMHDHVALATTRDCRAPRRPLRGRKGLARSSGGGAPAVLHPRLLTSRPSA